MGLFNFFKKVNKGSKTLIKLQELLLPELSQLLMFQIGGGALEATRALYQDALHKIDVNDLDVEGEVLTRVGIILALELNLISNRRSERSVAFAISTALNNVILLLEFCEYDKEYVKTFKTAQAEFQSNVALGIEGFSSE